MVLYIVGIGPGSREGMTIAANEAISRSDLIVGYTTYIDLIRPIFPEKEFLSTGMRQERARVETALSEAKHRTVSLVCSGDPALYGMAELALTLADAYPGTDIEIVPDDLGRPVCALHGGAAARAEQLCGGGWRVFVSITHERDMAAATAVLEKL